MGNFPEWQILFTGTYEIKTEIKKDNNVIDSVLDYFYDQEKGIVILSTELDEQGNLRFEGSKVLGLKQNKVIMSINVNGQPKEINKIVEMKDILFLVKGKDGKTNEIWKKDPIENDELTAPGSPLKLVYLGYRQKTIFFDIKLADETFIKVN
jgi:hypothetical protein